MAKVLKGEKLWGALQGQKERATETVTFKFGDVEGEVTIAFRDADEIEKVEDMIEIPERPTIKPEGFSKSFQVPVQKEDKKYNYFIKFADHPEYKSAAEEWKEKAEPLQMEKTALMAHEYIIDEEKTSPEHLEVGDTIKHKNTKVEVVKVTDKSIFVDYKGQEIEFKKDDPILPAKILLDRLRLSDLIKIVNAGNELAGFSTNSKEQNED